MDKKQIQGRVWAELFDGLDPSVRRIIMADSNHESDEYELFIKSVHEETERQFFKLNH